MKPTHHLDQTLLRILITDTPLIFYVLDADGMFLLSEGQDLQKIGLTPNEAVGRSIWEMYQDVPVVLEAFEQALGGKPAAFESVMNDTIFESRMTPIWDSTGTVTGVSGVARDITEAKNMEKELAQAQSFQKSLIDSVPGLLYMYTADGRLKYWNKGHETLTGYSAEELSRMTLMDWYKDDEESQRAVLKGLESTASDGFGEAEANLQCKDGTIRPYYFTACPLVIDDEDYFVGIGVDISSRIAAEKELMDLNRSLEEKVSERTRDLETVNEELVAANRELVRTNERIRLMQDQLVESEKMAALSGLVTGVAHEVNTPLGTGITASSHLSDLTKALLADHDRSELSLESAMARIGDIGEIARIIQENLLRAGGLVQTFKQLSVDQSSEPIRVFNLGEYLDGILLSLKSVLRKTKVEVVVRLAEEIRIESYPGCYAQILSNLIVNSVTHAYHPNDTGTIIIELSRNGSHVRLRYSDDGRGMDDETLKRVFDPFFSTQKVSGRAGLGLSIVYSIVTRQLGGSIRCESSPGDGTRFDILLDAPDPKA